MGLLELLAAGCPVREWGGPLGMAPTSQRGGQRQDICLAGWGGGGDLTGALGSPQHIRQRAGGEVMTSQRDPHLRLIKAGGGPRGLWRPPVALALVRLLLTVALSSVSSTSGQRFAEGKSPQGFGSRPGPAGFQAGPALGQGPEVPVQDRADKQGAIWGLGADRKSVV